jgi:DNA-binding HxlR family transcriptional regulator
MGTPLHPVCARYHRAVELIGRRWTGAIVRLLLEGRARYAVLREAIPDITDRMLSERLRELEAEGLVARHVTAEVPVRVEYELTHKGRALEKAVTAIAEWAERWIPAGGAVGDRPTRRARPRTTEVRSRRRTRAGAAPGASRR